MNLKIRNGVAELIAARRVALAEHCESRRREAKSVVHARPLL
jgi:hypothetical protein